MASGTTWMLKPALGLGVLNLIIYFINIMCNPTMLNHLERPPVFPLSAAFAWIVLLALVVAWILIACIADNCAVVPGVNSYRRHPNCFLGSLFVSVGTALPALCLVEFIISVLRYGAEQNEDFRFFFNIFVPGVILYTLLLSLLHAAQLFRPSVQQIRNLMKGRGKITKPIILLHNHTDTYYSSCSPDAADPVRKAICVLDWEREVEPCRQMTDEVKATLLRNTRITVYVEAADSVENAYEKLPRALEEIRKGKDIFLSMLCIVFVMPEPKPMEVPKGLGYTAQLQLLTVADIEDLSFQSLLEKRLDMLDTEWSEENDFVQQMKCVERESDDPVQARKDLHEKVRKNCEAVYQRGGTEILDVVLTDSATVLNLWPELLQEFFRGAMNRAPMLTSYLAMMDMMDLMLRLALYTVYGLRGETAVTEKTVPEDFGALGECLLRYTRPGDAVYENLHQKIMPCEMTAQRADLANILDVDLEGNGYSFYGLCYFLRYARNKTRGHGSVQEDNVPVLWAYSVEMAAMLSSMLCMERFEICLDKNKVMAGWDGKLVDLTPFAFPRNHHFALKFTCRKKELNFIDYFDGALIAPEFLSEE